MKRPVNRNDVLPVRCLPVLLGSVLAVAGSFALARPAAATGAANGSTVLIFSKSVVGGTTSLEATTAVAHGLTVEIADDTAWAAKSSADFATYRAIILGDPDCVQNTNLITSAVQNKNVWGSAVTGNIVVVGSDPASHASQGGDALTDAAIGFVTERPGRTGAYISLSCYYLGAAASTPVPLLDGISPGGFTVHGAGCFNAAHLVATDPGLAGLTDATISNWNCSVHESFDTWPADFLVLGMVSDDVGGGFTASDGSVGSPYMVARGLQLAAIGLSVTPTAASGLIGTSHTVTAQLVNANTGTPLAGRRLAFKIVSGPNSGAAGTCSPATCITDASGTVSFSYTGGGGAGDDAILAFADANTNGHADVGEAQTSARQTWGLCGDGTVEAGEQCDPAAAPTCTGRTVCLPSCICGCATDNDCADGNACNGQERCNPDTHQCLAGTPIVCNDGNVCNGTETCNPDTGACVSGTPAGSGTPCDADGDPCSTDACNGAGGCVNVGHAALGTPCDDGIFCDGHEACDGTGQCVSDGAPCPGTPCNHTCQEATRSCFDPAGALCNDSDPGTVDDICNSTGVCQGVIVTGDFAVLRWDPTSTHVDVQSVLGWGVSVNGPVCADAVHMRQVSTIRGDAIAFRTQGVAMSFGTGNVIERDLVTGGGKVAGLSGVRVGGAVDTGGISTRLGDCGAGAAKASQRRSQFKALPPGLTLGAVRVPAGATEHIPATGTLGAGQIVVDATNIRVGMRGTLELVGGPTTQQVIVRVQGNIRMLPGAVIRLNGLTPEQVLFLVDGSFTMMKNGRISGTVFGGDVVYSGWGTTVNGALLGSKTISVLKESTLNLHSFNGW